MGGPKGFYPSRWKKSYWVSDLFKQEPKSRNINCISSSSLNIHPKISDDMMSLKKVSSCRLPFSAESVEVFRCLIMRVLSRPLTRRLPTQSDKSANQLILPSQQLTISDWLRNKQLGGLSFARLLVFDRILNLVIKRFCHKKSLNNK